MKKKVIWSIIAVCCLAILLIGVANSSKESPKIREELNITSEDSGSVSAHKARSKRLIKENNTKVYGIN